MVLIHYPVGLDNSFVTWQNFSNHFWPAHYLINKQGKVVYEHFGEGDYDVTENNIRFLLGIDMAVPLAASDNPLSFYTRTPETYLGYARADTGLSPSLTHDQITQYYFPKQLADNAWALQGGWLVDAEKIVSAQSHSSLRIHFKARKVFIVMGNNTKKPIQVKLLLNGKPLKSDNKGKDVSDSSILVDRHSIYEAVSLPQSGSGLLELSPNEPGLEIYTFTFGG